MGTPPPGRSSTNGAAARSGEQPREHLGKVLGLVLAQVEAAHREVPKGHGRLTLNKTECAGGGGTV